MYKLYLILLTFIACSTCYAQKFNYEPGYLLQKSDTIHGYIKSAPNVELSQSVEFKPNADSGSFTTYYPDDIDGFGFTESRIHFYSVEAEIKNSTTHRFAKLLVSGYSSLYKLPLKESEQFIILKRDNKHIYVLKKEDRYMTLGQYESWAENNKVNYFRQYIGILNFAFSDCENLNENLDRLAFNDKSIMRVVEKYNACKAPEQTSMVYDSKVKPITKHGLEAGYAILVIPNSSAIMKSEGYSLGYFWDIIKPDVSRRISSRLGINYLYLQYDYTYFGQSYENNTIHFVRFPLLGQINLKDPIISNSIPFLQIGLTGQFSTDQHGIDIIPYVTIGAGLYHQKMKFSASIDNYGFGFRDSKIVNFTVGYRLK
ncbi:hypothetical protein [Pontibacter sp. SGAir0037]|uniref:hypothetical protein n=1 Tax=Pontibacter sp. SGAir0037 TaxID=2571030 RepID=UPI0010CD1663|nr:hypothetical protein [Pontibacter sp. SGAir0037]QCR22641.1 hypothetical protein C1N53_10005 [Pontibacter sp. SGAir0037]